jgi:hypothetical protein
MTVVGQDEFPLVGWLVGGLEPWNFMTFNSVGNVIIPTDFHNFQRGWYTTNQTYSTAFYVIPLRFGMI